MDTGEQQPKPSERPSDDTSMRTVATPEPNYVSETESDASSIAGADERMKKPIALTREQMARRIDSLTQENRVLKLEIEALKIKVRGLHDENTNLRQRSVAIQARAEQEEEFISNSLLKKIRELKKEKEQLALNYEHEEEAITNELSRKLVKIQKEKKELAEYLQKEQESLVTKFTNRIQKLETETAAKQQQLDEVRREKVQLECTLEQEQEALVNRMWKKLDKLEQEKKYLQEKLDTTTSAPPSPMDTSSSSAAVPPGSPRRNSRASQLSGTSGNGAALNSDLKARSLSGSRTRPAGRPHYTHELHSYICQLRDECAHLREQLSVAQTKRAESEMQLTKEEQENLRLRRKLEMEQERCNELFRHLSESESSLEIEDERVFNELSSHGVIPAPLPTSAGAAVMRQRMSPSLASGRISPALGALNVAVNFQQQNQAAAVNTPLMQPVASPTSPFNRIAAQALVCTSCGCRAGCGNVVLQHHLTNVANVAPAYMMAVASHQQHLARTRSTGGTNNDQQPHSRSGSSASERSNMRQSTSGQAFARPANPPSAPPAPLSGTMRAPPSPSSVQRSKTPDAKP